MEGLTLLLELNARISRVTAEEIILPTLERPEDAQVLGYAPLSLQQIFTVYAALNEEVSNSDLVKEEARLTDQANSASARMLPHEERVKLCVAVQTARAKLSPFETQLDVLWTLFIAEAALLFPSDAYMDNSVTVYSDWSIAIDPGDEDDLEEGKGAALLTTESVPSRERLN